MIMMDGIDKLLEYIRAQADAQCAEISQDATGKCKEIRAEYSRTEQGEYWEHISIGSKETEHRHEQLRNLAAMESKKKLLATQQEMVDEAFALAAKKLQELPKREYSKVLTRLGMDTHCSAEDIVEKYRAELSLKIVSMLFD
jgi:V/A-type H+-transporting ATPase subunit E